MKYRHTFTLRGYVVAVIYNSTDADDAAMHVCGIWDKVRTEAV